MSTSLSRQHPSANTCREGATAATAVYHTMQPIRKSKTKTKSLVCAQTPTRTAVFEILQTHIDSDMCSPVHEDDDVEPHDCMPSSFMHCLSFFLEHLCLLPSSTFLFVCLRVFLPVCVSVYNYGLFVCLFDCLFVCEFLCVISWPPAVRDEAPNILTHCLAFPT